MASSAVTSRIASKQQTIGEAYGAPENFLEIDVLNPETHGVGKKRYTDYEVRMRVSCRVTLQNVISHKFVNCVMSQILGMVYHFSLLQFCIHGNVKYQKLSVVTRGLNSIHF